MVLKLRAAIAVLGCLAVLIDGHDPAGTANRPAAPQRTPGVTLRGRVEIRHPARGAPPRPGIAELGADVAYRPQDRRRAVVFLETAPKGAFEEAGAERATMKQEHETFVPHVLAVQAGTTVDFPNADPFFHNVFSLSKPKRFDLGRYAKGRTKSVRFDQPGLVRVFCDIHSHMSAFILVFAHRFFAVTDDQGGYRIEGVPSGPSTLTVWYEGTVRGSRQLVLPEGGGTVDVNFSVEGR